ncbi:TlpA disulfide reductase family protein (plasmid) [Photobacterium sp. DA100]|uniref:TlpA family protein disulfide reductase n=1 Tax=Photobacterium sp. DA100 TaxID=3027472 RepID=UPI002478331E|nr:TlpA disulfide reductase family protein [Photobacterium sp. DA100]WEM45762.1 TlpA disulfide reductase family protein [Photobacterium sp. DA100]
MNKIAFLFGSLVLTAIANASQCPAPDGFIATDGSQRWESNTKPVTLVNLWAVWCPPCLKELPMLDSIANSNIYAIDTIHLGDVPDSVDVKFKQLQIKHLPKTIEPDLALLQQLGFQGLPASFVVIDNRIVYRYSGYINQEAEFIRHWLQCLSKENTQ